MKNKKQQKEGVQSRLPINFAPSANLKNLLMPEGTDRQRRLWAVEETHLMKEVHLSASERKLVSVRDALAPGCVVLIMASFFPSFLNDHLVESFPCQHILGSCCTCFL